MGTLGETIRVNFEIGNGYFVIAGCFRIQLLQLTLQIKKLMLNANAVNNRIICYSCSLFLLAGSCYKRVRYSGVSLYIVTT